VLLLLLPLQRSIDVLDVSSYKCNNLCIYKDIIDLMHAEQQHWAKPRDL
jgi:hypothetical protein